MEFEAAIAVPVSRLFHQQPPQQLHGLALTRTGRFVSSAADRQFMLDLWAATTLSARVIICIGVAINIAYLAIDLVHEGSDVAIVAYDATALALCAVELGDSMRWRRSAMEWRKPRPHGQVPRGGYAEAAGVSSAVTAVDGSAAAPGAPATAVTVSSHAAARTDTHSYVTRPWRDALLAALCVLWGFRLTYIALVRCTTDGGARVPGCAAYVSGGFPADAIAFLLLVGAVYAAVLAMTELAAYVALTLACCGVAAGQVTLSAQLVARQLPGGLSGARDKVFNIVLLVVILALTLVGLSFITRRRLRAQRWHFAAQVALEQEQAAVVRLAREEAVAAAALADASAAEAASAAARTALDTAASFVAHQLRNPLHHVASIVTSTEEVGGKLARPDAAALLAEVATIVRVTDDMLLHQELVAGRVVPTAAPASVRLVVADALRGTGLTAAVGPEVPTVAVFDARRARQLVAAVCQAVLAGAGGAVPVPNEPEAVVPVHAHRCDGRLRLVLEIRAPTTADDHRPAAAAAQAPEMAQIHGSGAGPRAATHADVSAWGGARARSRMHMTIASMLAAVLGAQLEPLEPLAFAGGPGDAAGWRITISCVAATSEPTATAAEAGLAEASAWPQPAGIGSSEGQEPPAWATPSRAGMEAGGQGRRTASALGAAAGIAPAAMLRARMQRPAAAIAISAPLRAGAAEAGRGAVDSQASPPRETQPAGTATGQRQEAQPAGAATGQPREARFPRAGTGPPLEPPTAHAVVREPPSAPRAFPSGPTPLLSTSVSGGGATGGGDQSGGTPAPTRPLHVLVVDDEEVNRRINRRLLERGGHTVSTACDGDEVNVALASAAATARPIDAIVMDIMMPRLGGEAACERLRAAGVRLPIIAATANASASDRERYLRSGFDAVLAKPFHAAALKACLNEALAGAGIGRS
jgi:CheY-like chemotaxis protein